MSNFNYHRRGYGYIGFALQEIEIGLGYLRPMTIDHRDLKPANTLHHDCCVVGPENQGKETTQGSEMEQGNARGGLLPPGAITQVLSRFTKKSFAPFSSCMESMERKLYGGEISDCERKMLYPNTDRTGFLEK